MFERIVRWSCFAFGVVLVRLGLPSEFPLLSWQGETMGSVYTVKVVATNLGDSGCAALKRAVDNRLKEVNRQMSHYQSDSEISRFNRTPAREPFPISSGFARVLRTAHDISRQIGRAHV